MEAEKQAELQLALQCRGLRPQPTEFQISPLGPGRRHSANSWSIWVYPEPEPWVGGAGETWSPSTEHPL